MASKLLLPACLFIPLIVGGVPAPASRSEGSSPMSLADVWSFQLDREDRGEADEWFERALSDAIVLPGVLTAQGYGDPVSMQTSWTGNLSRQR